METFQLLEKYLKEQRESYKDVQLSDYSINGSIIKLRYSYNPDYDVIYTSYNNYLEVDILDYMTWIYNSKKKQNKV